MNLFDSLVESALSANKTLEALRPVVEKEILHHDILREMSDAGFLTTLTFIGGTCLRSCYGSSRLSEDLDFTGGAGFKRNDLADLSGILETGLFSKYGLSVKVSEPVRETGNVDTWKIRVVTRPERPHLPAQRIHIDICAVSSFDRRPAVLINHYRINSGTSGLILYAESLQEIFADKMLALALRPNRVKNRDLWDILWLHSQGIVLDRTLIARKLDERNVSYEDFLIQLHDRITGLDTGFSDYSFEMSRFLPRSEIFTALEHPLYWESLLTVLRLHESTTSVFLADRTSVYE
jgi:predicted nucleotidyltransferase component of viral defense system